MLDLGTMGQQLFGKKSGTRAELENAGWGNGRSVHDRNEVLEDRCAPRSLPHNPLGPCRGDCRVVEVLSIRNVCFRVCHCAGLGMVGRGFVRCGCRPAGRPDRAYPGNGSKNAGLSPNIGWWRAPQRGVRAGPWQGRAKRLK